MLLGSSYFIVDVKRERTESREIKENERREKENVFQRTSCFMIEVKRETHWVWENGIEIEWKKWKRKNENEWKGNVFAQWSSFMIEVNRETHWEWENGIEIEWKKWERENENAWKGNVIRGNGLVSLIVCLRHRLKTFSFFISRTCQITLNRKMSFGVGLMTAALLCSMDNVLASYRWHFRIN